MPFPFPLPEVVISPSGKYGNEGGVTWGTDASGHPFGEPVVAPGYPPGTPLNTYSGPVAGADTSDTSDQSHYYSGYWAGVQAAQYGLGGNSYGNLKPWPFGAQPDDPSIYRFRRREPLIREAMIEGTHTYLWLLFPRPRGLPHQRWDEPPTTYEDLPPEADTHEASADDGLQPTLASYDPFQFNPLPFLRRIQPPQPFDDLIDNNQSTDWRGAAVPLENVAPMTNDGFDAFAGISSQLSGDTRMMAGELSDTGSHLTRLMPFFPLYPDLSYPAFQRFFGP